MQPPCLNKEVSHGTFQRCDPKISAVRLKSHRAVKLTNLGLWSDIGRRRQDLESKQKQVSRVFPSFLRTCFFFFRFGSLGIHRYASRGLNTNQRRKERRPHSLGGIILWRMIWPCFLPMLPVLWWNLPMLSICHHYSSLECCNFHSGNCSSGASKWCQLEIDVPLFKWRDNWDGCRHVTSFRLSWASRPSKPTFRGCNGSTMKTKSPLAPETPDTSRHRRKPPDDGPFWVPWNSPWGFWSAWRTKSHSAEIWWTLSHWILSFL